jgi:phenylpropionate dioxygenase-like ring-hydroxylating dioxygenase large terminal subunit
MAMIDHWHPVLESERLRRRPVRVQLAGRDIALFRTSSGAPAALADSCPHRRMRLSRGAVVGDRVQCPSHGWTFDACGYGESPGTPKLHACAESFEVREAHGAVWVKSRDSTPVFPRFDVAGYLPTCRLRHQIPAPLEVVVNNFCEIEHTPTVHGVFGYDLDRIHEVTVQFDPTDKSLHVRNAGPSKPLGPLLGTLLGVGRRYHFYDDWTTHFSPVYSVYDHWWADPATGRESRVRWRLYLLFTPLDDARTEVMTFAYAKSRWPGPAVFGCSAG